MATNRFTVPVIHPVLPPAQRAYPISPRENLLRALAHEKPLWMPVVNDAIEWVFPAGLNDLPADRYGDGERDWFGTEYRYAPAQGGGTPCSTLFGEIGEWRTTVRWPDPGSVDWREGAAGFRRDPDRVLGLRLCNGGFERLHMLEGFEQALCDLLIEPEECGAFFERMCEYQTALFCRMHEAYAFDIVFRNDDWASARAQFFSCKTFEETLLRPAAETAEAVHAAGCRYVAHCCGKMEAFLPYLVRDIGADGVEIQGINDIRGLLDRFGASLTPIFPLDAEIMYDPNTTPAWAREYAREIVDRFGAHTCDGAGAAVRLVGADPAVYYAFEDELYRYSSDRYAGLR